MPKKIDDGMNKLLKSLDGLDGRFQKAYRACCDKEALAFAQEDNIVRESHRNGHPNNAPSPSLKNRIKAGKAWLGQGEKNIIHLLD
jgi:hypothetical protein